MAGQLVAGATDLQIAGEDLVGRLDRAAVTLAGVSRRLEEEFASRFAGDGVNPLSIIKRLKRLERELPQLKEQCQELISAKQELTDSARALLRGNRDQLQALVARSGAPAHDDARVLAAFDTAMGEWDHQMRQAREAGGAAGGLDYSAQGLNMALARSNLQ